MSNFDQFDQYDQDHLDLQWSRCQKTNTETIAVSIDEWRDGCFPNEKVTCRIFGDQWDLRRCLSSYGFDDMVIHEQMVVRGQRAQVVADVVIGDQIALRVFFVDIEGVARQIDAMSC